jgi:maltose alpha-D-glucosyltransferase/alpha-amylase
MVQRMIPNQGDGWKMTLEELGRYFEHSRTHTPLEEELKTAGQTLLQLSDHPVPEFARDHVGIYIDSAATLGRRTAEMHLALATESDDPAFIPERITKLALNQLASMLREHASAAFDALKSSLPGLPDEFVDRAGQTLGLRKRLIDRFRTLDQMETELACIRVHGDYHLGQVLWVQNDFVILDFEGEPARPLAERRTKQIALKDVAGMLRSLSYAAFASLLNYTARRLEEYDQLEPWAGFWERWTSVAFLKAYRETARDAPFLPTNADEFETLLDAFLLDKALYELRYELNNRPTWVRIPLRGIVGLAR